MVELHPFTRKHFRLSLVLMIDVSAMAIALLMMSVGVLSVDLAGKVVGFGTIIAMPLGALYAFRYATGT